MQTERMTDSFRDHIADVLADYFGADPDDHEDIEEWAGVADALLADPDLRAIIDLALRHVDRYDTPEVWALLADWRE